MKAGCILLVLATSAALADDSLKPPNDEAWAWLGDINMMPEGGWIPLVWAASKDSIGFVSSKRYVREGSIVTFWMRWEYKPQSRYPSVLQRAQYDCTKAQYRSISQTSYTANNMGGGSPESLTQLGQWSPIAPGTMGETIMDFVCSINTKKK